MSSLCPAISTLEELPDELLLFICRYLSSTDVLFSFYGLNSRLSQTISGYCRHVVLAQLPFKRFNFICTSILPSIGPNISSLVVSNQCKGVLSRKFLDYFGERMSLTFPCLKHLTLIAVNTKSLTPFLDCVQNLTELFEITICHLCTEFDDCNEAQNLLHRLFMANNNRLNSIIFDYYSDPFSINIQNDGVLFANIEKLNINLKTINDLHQLLTVLPRLCRLQTQIHEEFFVLDTQNEYSTIPTLKYFHLRSFCHSWDLDELISIIKRVPNVEELSIAIESSDDIQLMDGEEFFSLLSTLSLRKFNYYLEFLDLSSSIDPTTILSTWEQFQQEFICVKSDDNKTLALYTIPFAFPYLILSSSLAKNDVFIQSYTAQVRKLVLYDISANIMDTFVAIKKCHKMHTLSLRIDEDIVPRKSFYWIFNKINSFCL
jgi:hypothetical protein